MSELVDVFTPLYTAFQANPANFAGTALQNQ